jgi:myo-inositol 2-dehydrogenase/D-chiro-inositol 1-dehydrogenase
MVGVAVAGLGEIGRLHARNLAGCVPGARLVGLVDQIADRAASLGTELAVPWSTSYERALRDPDIDAVVIATSTPAHVRMVLAAAEAGRHVFCEKPLSLDAASGRAATHAMRDAGRCLQVGFQRRCDPNWAAAKRAIDSGELGEVRLLRISHRNREHPHGGATDRLGSLFVDMAVHDMDAARWLVGEARVVSALAPGAGTDADAALIVLEFDDGALAVVDVVRTAVYGFECSAEILGTLGTLRLEGRAGGLCKLTPGEVAAELPGDHIAGHATAYRAELCEFVECVSSGRTPPAGGEDSVAALELALAAERAHGR